MTGGERGFRGRLTARGMGVGGRAGFHTLGGGLGTGGKQLRVGFLPFFSIEIRTGSEGEEEDSMMGMGEFVVAEVSWIMPGSDFDSAAVAADVAAGGLGVLPTDSDLD